MEEKNEIRIHAVISIVLIVIASVNLLRNIFHLLRLDLYHDPLISTGAGFLISTTGWIIGIIASRELEFSARGKILFTFIRIIGGVVTILYPCLFFITFYVLVIALTGTT